MGKPPIKRKASDIISNKQKLRVDDERSGFQNDWEGFFSLWEGESDNPPSFFPESEVMQQLNKDKFVSTRDNIPSASEVEDLLYESAEMNKENIDPSDHCGSTDKLSVQLDTKSHSLHDEIFLPLRSDDKNGNLIIVPETSLTPQENPYTKEFYETGSLIIDKLRLKKHKLPSQGWTIFMKKENTGRYGTQTFKPSIFKLSLWESTELMKSLQVLWEEIQKSKLESVTQEIPRLRHPNSKCTDQQLDAYWDEHFTTKLTSENLQFRPVRYADGALTVKFFAKRMSSQFPSGGITMSVGYELLPFIVRGIKHLVKEIQSLEREKFGVVTYVGN